MPFCKGRFFAFMTTPFDQQPHDLGLKFLAPTGVQDVRVPLAEEFSLADRININLVKNSRRNGWSTLPQFNTQNNTIQVVGKANLQIYPQPLSINTQFVVPSLATTTAVIRQDNYLYLVGLAAEVGASQDPVLGQVSFRYRDPVANTIQSIEKENARRYRAFWLFVLSVKQLDPSSIINLLTTQVNGDCQIIIANTTTNGFQMDTGVQFYALDPNWTSGVAYTILTDSIELLAIASIQRALNYLDRGYVYGYQQEDPFSPLFIKSLALPYQKKDFPTAVRERLIDICAGIPGKGNAFRRTVQNLLAGQVGGNPGREGESASSPNGSVCLANDQRVSFTNQQIVQKLGVAIVTAGNDGSGNAVIATGLNTNAPLGSTFSENRSDHKIYTTNGLEQSSFGTFSNLGGSGSLQWVGGNTSIAPGDTIYFVPGIKYPSGSGFNIPIETIEGAYLAGVPISLANIRYGATNDISAYEDPANNENFIVIYGSERAALHYIYKKITISSNVNGVATIPSNEKGCFAFINGVTGRIDSPVATGLQPNTVYKALCYYPPRSTEAWQFQILYPEYQGIGLTNDTFLDGSIILTEPIAFAHSSGGGLSVHNGDAFLKDTIVAMQLPSLINDAIPYYKFDTPIYYSNEVYPGPVTWREIEILPIPGLVFPSPSVQIQSTAIAGLHNEFSLNTVLSSQGTAIGVRAKGLSTASPYQLVVAFAIAKGGNTYLCIATHNCSGNGYTDAIFSTAQNTAIDVFNL